MLSSRRAHQNLKCRKRKNPTHTKFPFRLFRERRLLHIRERHERGDEREREREREQAQIISNDYKSKDVSGIWISHLGLPKTKKKQSCTEHDSSKKLGYDDNNALGREAEKRKRRRKNHLRKGSMLMAQMRIRDKRPVDWIPQFFGSLHNPHFWFRVFALVGFVL